MAAIPTFAELGKMTAAQQDAFFTRYFPTFKSTVTAAWVKNDASLSPYEGDTALQMYQALKTAYPTATPLQRGSTVYKAWLTNGIGSTVQKITGAATTALGATATGIQTASILPGWTNPLTTLLSNLANANTWVRVGEVVLGLILLAVGAARLTHAPNLISTAVKAAAV